MRNGDLLPGSLMDLVSRGVLREEDVAGYRTQERVEPEYSATFPSGLHPDVVEAVKASGIGRLFVHQESAIRTVPSGDDIVLVSPTATGKTMCFNLPVISELYRDPAGHALYVYPMKALAHDQLLAIKAITQHLPRQHAVSSWPFDGDTDQDTRKLLKSDPPNIIITNPDSLHFAMLGWNEHWTNFLKKLRFLVLDEAHEYRGFFGTNVAYVIRRLLAVCAALGNRPRIILSSATIANPEDHAQALTGRGMQALHTERPGRPTKHFVFANPAYPDYRYEDLLIHRLADLTTFAVERGLSTLVFCPTRRMVERLAKRARQELKSQGLDEDLAAPYKSGYTSHERREIERGIKSGAKLVVFSTNALEIGIDMGRLDLVTMVGFPDTVMSAWQRAGRAGRQWDRDAYVLILASRSPIDQFYVNNIDLFMERPLDRLAVNLENEELLEPHAKCAIFELSGDRSKLTEDILGPHLTKVAAGMRPDMDLMKMRRPEMAVDLRSIGGQTYTITSGGETEIGTIGGDGLFSEVYIGAIYDHYGRSWRVRSHGAREVVVEPNEAFHYTRPVRRSFLNVEEIRAGRQWQESGDTVRLFYGRVKVTDALYGYREYEEKSGSMVDSVDYPAASVKTYRTDSVWLQLRDGLLNGSLIAAHSLEHALRATVPLSIPCDPFDIASWTTKTADGFPGVFLYDAVKGGIGISREAHADVGVILEMAAKLMEECRCDQACPRCIVVPRCFETAGALDRHEGAALARRLQALLTGHPSILAVDTLEWHDAPSE